MQRDMEIIRKILLAMEADPQGLVGPAFRVEGVDRDAVEFHAALMKEAGLIDGANVTGLTDSQQRVLPNRITWKGYEFLDDARSPEVWDRAMSGAKAAGGWSLAIFSTVLTTLATEAAMRYVGFGPK